MNATHTRRGNVSNTPGRRRVRGINGHRAAAAGWVVSELTVVLLILAVLAGLIIAGTDLDSSTPAAAGRAHPVRGVVASGPDGRLLAVLYDDHCVAHDLATSTSTLLWIGRSSDERIVAMAASPVVDHLALFHSDGYFDLVETQSGKIIWEQRLGDDRANCMAFSPDGEMLAVGTGEGQLLVISNRTGNIERRHRETSPINALCFTADGRQILFPHAGHTIGFYDIASGVVETPLEGSTRLVSSLAVSPDGQTLAAGTLEGNLILWDLDSGREIIRRKDSYFPTTEVAFTRNGDSILTGGCDGRLRVAPFSEANSVRTVPVHREAISGMALAGDQIVTGSHDGQVRAWNTTTLAERRIEL